VEILVLVIGRRWRRSERRSVAAGFVVVRDEKFRGRGRARRGHVSSMPRPFEVSIKPRAENAMAIAIVLLDDVETPD